MTIYDYDHQAWVVGGRYVRCAHPESSTCACYGRQHKGEAADVAAIMAQQTWEFRDPFSGWETSQGDTLEAALDAAYQDIPEGERPSYVWYEGRKVMVDGGTCTPV